MERNFMFRDPFNPPPDPASDFLGYFTAADKQTTCGNCHVGEQADWIQTKHAAAWEDLQGSGGAQPSCEGCHSVNSTRHWEAGDSILMDQGSMLSD